VTAASATVSAPPEPCIGTSLIEQKPPLITGLYAVRTAPVWNPPLRQNL
jgi:hypothetical protein